MLGVCSGDMEDWLCAQLSSGAYASWAYKPMHLLDLELFTADVAYSSLRFIVTCNVTLSNIPSASIVENK